MAYWALEEWVDHVPPQTPIEEYDAALEARGVFDGFPLQPASAAEELLPLTHPRGQGVALAQFRSSKKHTKPEAQAHSRRKWSLRPS